MSASTKALQVACSLNDDDFANRRKRVRRDLIPHIKHVERFDKGVRLDFSKRAAMRREVELFAEFERRCCGFLSFRVSEPGEPLSLTIAGPAGAEAVLDELATAASAGL